LPPAYWKSDKVVQTYKDVHAWKRPKNINKGKAPLLWGKKGISPRGVNQGKLGDCWFLASAAAISEHPARIKKIFTNKQYPQKRGVFEVTLYIKGKPTKVVIDDKLPVND